MPLSNLDHKKIYYYVISIMAFFVLMWGAVDLLSSSIGLVSIRAASLSAPVAGEGEALLPPEKGDQLFDSYYQGKMLQDRLWDSLARILVSGAIFGFCRYKVERLEEKT